MYKIVSRRELCGGIWEYVLRAPLVARAAKPGQFIIIRLHERGERIPLGIVDWDPGQGAVTVVFRERGKTTSQLVREYCPGDVILDVVGPLGNPVEIGRPGRVMCVGEDAWYANLYPLARALWEGGNEVICLVSTPNGSFWMDKFSAVAEVNLIGNPAAALRERLERERPALVWASGSPAMMRACSEICGERNIPIRVFLHPIMLDGTGICGSCRVEVGGEGKFVCLDGPTFDGAKVNWEALEVRLSAYREEERLALVRYFGKETG